MLKKSVVLSDNHIPFDDEKCRELTFDFIKYFKPDYIDLLGDLIDCWQISKFLKDPNRKESLQDDIDRAGLYLGELRLLVPNAEIVLHYGNHLARLRKYIWKNAQSLSCIRSLDLKFLLGLDKLKIRVIEEEEGYDRRGNLVLTHGKIISQDSAMTARRNLLKYGISVIHAHTHRLGSHFRYDLRGMVGAWENGCLCKMSLSKEWGWREVPNWMNGFSVITFKGNRFNVQQIPIIDGEILFGDRSFI